MAKKSNPIINLFRVEWNHLGNRKKLFVISSVLFIIANVINLLTPLVIGLIFNSVQQSITSPEELWNLIRMISLLLIIQLFFWVFHGVGRYIETYNGFWVNRNYINSKINKVLDLPVKWHKDHHSGDTIDKINRSASGLNSFSSTMTFQLISTVVSVIGSLAILFLVDFKIAIFTFLYSTVVLFFIFRLDRKLVGYYKELNKKSNFVSAGIYDYIGNIITVVTLRLKKMVQKEINSRLMESENLTKKSAVLNELKWSTASISISLMTVLALSFKAYSDFYSSGVILVGTLYVLYGYLGNVGRSFYSFASLYGSITRNNASLLNANIVDEEFSKIRGEVYRKLPNRWNSIELKGVDFSYNEEGDTKHMDDVDFVFRRGQKIALVGESGSGKSTILTLLRGLYEADKGNVYLDGKIVNYGFSMLKNSVTLIPQEPEIFNDTIKNNITMGIRKKNDEIDEVVRMAQLSNVIKKLDNGLNTNVMERGVSLSGGEKQRLALARGLLAARDSEIVLLDEPTSSVDSANEMKIHENLFSKFSDKTIISSIHRLHLLEKFDYIYLFEKGKIIAQGDLAEIRKNTKFNYIWRKYGLNKEM